MPGYSGASSRVQAASFMWPGCWKEFLNPIPLGIRVVSLLFPLTRTGRESPSQLLDSSSSLINSQQKARPCLGFDPIPNTFVQFPHLQSSFSCDREELVESYSQLSCQGHHFDSSHREM